MPLLVRAFPLARPVAELQQFVDELKSRRSETDAFYRSYGLSHESWHIQDTPAGPWVIGVAKVADPMESGPRFAASSAAFESWFKARVLDLSGVDLNNSPLGPPTRQVFEWSDPSDARNNLCA